MSRSNKASKKIERQKANLVRDFKRGLIEEDSFDIAMERLNTTLKNRHQDDEAVYEEEWAR